MPNRRQAIIWTTADPIHWRIYEGLGEDELMTPSGSKIRHIVDSFRRFAKNIYDSMVWTVTPDGLAVIAFPDEMMN